ncbi:MAG: hypothetical protein V2A34_00810 [Lentisphaerota bacterium]
MTNKIKIVIFLALVGVLTLILFVLPSKDKRAWSKALVERETATRMLAEYLAAHYPGQEAVVVGNPFIKRSGQSSEVYKFEDAGVRGLKKGFGKSVSIKNIAHPEIRNDFLNNPASVYIDPTTKTPLSYVVSDGAFDQIIKDNADCGILVSLIGLPANLEKTKFWTQAGAPRLGLLLPDLRMIGNEESIRRAVKSGRIAAAIFYKPGSGNAAKLEDRFILLDADNADEWLRTYSMVR